MKIAEVILQYSTVSEMDKHAKYMWRNGFRLERHWRDDITGNGLYKYAYISTDEPATLCLDPEHEPCVKTETVPQITYIDAVHFGNKQPFTWRVPEHLVDKVSIGKIVKVETQSGHQLVEVVKVYTKEGNPAIHRNVVSVLVF